MPMVMAARTEMGILFPESAATEESRRGSRRVAAAHPRDITGQNRAWRY